MLKLIQFLIDLLFKVIPQPPLSLAQIKNIKIVAHRGCHESGLIENTLPAFVWCMDHNIWGIEFDIRFTSDNIPVVHHDSHCGRLFHKPQLIISQIKFIELKNKIPDIPSLMEVVQKCGKRIHFMIEIKSVLSMDQNQILENILAPIKSKVDYHILSLKIENFDSISFVKHDCYLPVAELNVGKFVNYAIQKKYAGIAGHYLLITQSIIRRLSTFNLNTGVGYVASKNSLIREICRNHHWIFTDRASSVKEWVEKLSQNSNANFEN